MFRFFYPAAYYESIFDIPLNKLKKNNIKGLIFDVDNTLSPYYEKHPNEKTITFIKDAIDNGFTVCLLSNNSKKRLTIYNEKLKLLSIPRAYKPLKRGIKKAMQLMGTNEKETVIIGDQVFTDIWCGKRAGVRTILVKPCSEKDELIVKLKRYIENIVLRDYLKNKKK